MNDAKGFSSNDEFLLNECYELALQHESLDISKDVLRTKLRQLDVRELYQASDRTIPEDGMIYASEISKDLSYESLTRRVDGPLGSSEKIMRIGNVAEREYLMSLMELRMSNTETGRNAALEHLSQAYAYAPHDPRIVTLIQILRDVGRK